MGIFSDLNARISRNVLEHGHYLTDPGADHPQKLDETVELLIHFVRPDSRDTVRAGILKLIYDNRDPALRVGASER